MSPTEFSPSTSSLTNPLSGPSRALIVGASMAGLCAAAQLSSIGYEVTIVERSPHLRLTGSPIDVRGGALQVAADMGILDEIRQKRVSATERMVFTTFVNSDDSTAAELPLEMANDSDDDVEVAREALVDILNGTIGSSVEFIYHEGPRSIAQDESSVAVEFVSGRTSQYDIVVGADGIHSSVRRLVMGPESAYRKHLGVYYAIVDLPPGSCGISNESRTFNAPGRMAGINDYGDRSYGVFAFLAPELDYDYRNPQSQKEMLVDAFSEIRGWHVPFLLQEVQAATDIYFDSVSQVLMPRWSSGRVVLAGDAAHAASLFSGRGTSLAMMGAAWLAEELARNGGDYEKAFSAYEARLRPFVLSAQEGVMEARDFMVPASERDIEARNRRFTERREHKLMTASPSLPEAGSRRSVRGNALGVPGFRAEG